MNTMSNEDFHAMTLRVDVDKMIAAIRHALSKLKNDPAAISKKMFERGVEGATEKGIAFLQSVRDEDAAIIYTVINVINDVLLEEIKLEALKTFNTSRKDLN